MKWFSLRVLVLLVFSTKFGLPCPDCLAAPTVVLSTWVCKAHFHKRQSNKQDRWRALKVRKDLTYTGGSVLAWKKVVKRDLKMKSTCTVAKEVAGRLKLRDVHGLTRRIDGAVLY